jgi:hypothetical protein
MLSQENNFITMECDTVLLHSFIILERVFRDKINQ